MARQLMLAQAQLCFYEKAVKDKKSGNMKPTIIAKIAMQTSKFYSSACSYCGAASCSSILDVSWFAITDFQQNCFRGAAEYWQGVASKEAALQKGSGYGEEICRLRRAELWVQKSLDVSKKYSLAPSLPAGADGLLQKIRVDLQSALHDLNTVYLESIPQDHSLDEVAPVTMVKTSVIPDAVPGDGFPAAVLFSRLLPKRVKELLKNTNNSMRESFMRCQSAVFEANALARNTLSSVGLPGSLEVANAALSDPLPPSVWARVTRIQEIGGMDRLNAAAEELQEVSRRALATMASIDESLEREDRKDGMFRSRFPSYNGVHSSFLTADIRGNNSKMRDAFTNAQKSDELIREQLRQEDSISSSAVTLRMLTKCSRQDLLKLFPKRVVDLLDFDEHAISSINGTVPLEEALQALADLIESRDKSLSELSAAVEKDYSESVNECILKQLDVAPLLSEALQRCKEPEKQIMQGMDKQKTLLENILHFNAIFTQGKESDPFLVEVDAVLKTLEQCVAKFFTLQAQISGGVTFYSNLQSKLTTLMQSSDDLAFTQQWQRQEFEMSRDEEAVRQSQESKDHEMALELAKQFEEASAPPLTESLQKQYPGAVVGTLVGGPPSHFLQTPAAPPAAPTAALPYLAPPAVAANVSSSSGHYFHQDPPQLQQPYQPQYAQPPPQTTLYNPPSAPAQMASPYYTQPPTQQQMQPQQHYQQQTTLPMTYPAVPSTAPTQPQQPQYAYLPPAAAAAAPQNSYFFGGMNPSTPTTSAAPFPQQQPVPAVPAGFHALPTQPQYAAVQAPPPPPAAQATAPPQVDFATKVTQLCDMGFPYDRVKAALLANNGDQEAATNALLSENTEVEAKSASQSKPANSSWWGSGKK